MKNLSQTEWENLYEELDNSIILDVRTEQEYLDGKIPNSLNIDILNPQKFMSKVELLNKSSNYFVYCKAGSRSAQACLVMNQLGFENIYNLEEGFLNWKGDVIY